MARPTSNENYVLVTATATQPTTALLPLSRRISECGCNVLEARLSTLGQDVVIACLAVGSWDAIAKLEASAPRLEREESIKVAVSRTGPKEQQSNLLPYVVEVVSADKPGVLHSFNGNLETAQTAIALRFYIGVTGPVTYKKAEEKRQIIRQLPLERLLIETDSPFLAPVPHRGKRNEPAFVAHIADKIAEIHSTTREQIANITASNAADLFGWGG